MEKLIKLVDLVWISSWGPDDYPMDINNDEFENSQFSRTASREPVGIWWQMRLDSGQGNDFFSAFRIPETQ